MTTGRSSELDVEIVAGLQEGDRVLLRAPEGSETTPKAGAGQGAGGGNGNTGGERAGRGNGGGRGGDKAAGKPGDGQSAGPRRDGATTKGGQRPGGPAAAPKAS